VIKGICYCNVSGCHDIAFIRIFSSTGKTVVAKYCKQHAIWGIEQIARSDHIIRKVKP
jgi:hypothetical protein